jgi:Mg-chelatase subunit ChlD
MSSLTKVLPKVVLFGLFGLLGAAAAALLAEPLWYLLQPAASKSAQPELRMSAPTDVVLDKGGKNRFSILVARDHFTGPVVLNYKDLPSGVRINDAVLASEQDRVDLDVTADPSAPVGEKEITVNGIAERAAASARIKLRVEAPPAPQLDLMFVLDVTGSMQKQIDGVRESIFNFARELQTKGLDFRIAMLAFRDRLNGEEPELLTFEEGPFTRDLKRFQDAVGRLKADGGGDEPESSMDALTLAARQPFRPTASKVLLLITDATPKLPDKETKTVEEAVAVLKEHKIDQVHLIIADFTRPNYQPIKDAMSGNLFFSLDQASKSSSSFADFLPAVGKEVARTASATQAPRALATAPPAPPPIKGVQSSQEYEAGSGGRLVFLACMWTALVGAGICLALMEAQARFVRQRSLSRWEVGKGLAGGIAAGLLGGFAGQLLFDLTAAASLEPAFRIFGWVVLGAVVGLGLAFFVPNLSPWRGAAGGAVGGGLGAAAFLGLSAAAGDVTGRLLGAALLGLAVGLMVALIEQMSRRIWLSVSSGGQVRTVALGTTPVFLGSDASRCQIWIPQTPGRALRYLLRDGRIEVVDLVREQTYVVNRGDRRQLGQAIVEVCGEG